MTQVVLAQTPALRLRAKYGWKWAVRKLRKNAPYPGKNSPFEKLMPNFADALRAHGCANVEIEVINNSAHYAADEQPDAVAQLIERYASL